MALFQISDYGDFLDALQNEISQCSPAFKASLKYCYDKLLALRRGDTDLFISVVIACFEIYSRSIHLIGFMDYLRSINGHQLVSRYACKVRLSG